MQKADVLPINGIDTHAHVFRRGLPLTDVRRYTPDYDALPDEYLQLLTRSGLSHGVLVQPSFLGTDNSFMLDVLRRHPDRLRGIAMVTPDIGDDELDELRRNGIAGIRLNLIGLPLENYAEGPWHKLFRRLAERDLLVEIHREAIDLASILPPILAAGVRVVVDHFGRPDPALGIDDPGFRALLSVADSGRLWVKLSATYRNNSTIAQAKAMTALLRDAFGSRRLLWGSDWPNTQHEACTGYADEAGLIARLLPDDAERQTVLVDVPAALFGFR